MTDFLTIDINAQGQSIDALQNLVAQRVAVMGETTSQAVTATAINLLKSVRAATRVVDVKKATTDGFFVRLCPQMTAGFYGTKGIRKGRRGIRTRGGHHMEGVRVINLLGDYQRGEKANVYTVIYRYNISGHNVENTQHERQYVIASHESQVCEWAGKWFKKKVEQFAGMAKWNIGQAMSKIAVAGGAGESAKVAVKAAAKKVGLANLKVEVEDSGYDQGRFSIHVADTLDYAGDALKGGAAMMNEFVQKAANRTAGIIQNWINRKGADFFSTKIPKIETPFPELVGKRPKK